MKKMKHAPGPWSIQAPHRTDVAGCRYRILDAQGDGFAEVHAMEEYWPNAELNARLIAASPTMFDVLTEIAKGRKGYSDMDLLDFYERAVALARDAITKATK